MNLLGKVFNFLSPRADSKTGTTAQSHSPLATRAKRGVQKPKASNAREQQARKQKLADAALRELNNGVAPLSQSRTETRLGHRDGRADNVEEEIETSQPDQHEIDVETENSSSGASDSESSEGALHEDKVEEEDPEEQQWTLTGLSGYRWNDGEIEVRVDWKGGESTWEPERNIHQDAPDILFKYWDARGGRPANPDDPELFDIFAIRNHSKRRFLVEWTGFPPSENTWMARNDIVETAPHLVHEYRQELKRQQQ